MTAVGLFWIAEDFVYLGAEPVGTASGVRLTEESVEALGTNPSRFWTWREVRRIGVHDVPVRSAARRRVSVAFSSLYVAATGDGELPPAYTVRVDTADACVEVSVVSAVVGGFYSPAEHQLSCALLSRFADGGATVGDLLGWRRGRAADGTPPREEREALLRKWVDAN